jgi:hypothetical protein
MTQAHEENPYQGQLDQLPRISVGALFMPPIWGPAHGFWSTILFYPLWLIADTCFTNAVLAGGVFWLLSAIVFVGTAAFTVFFARTSRIKAYLRVADEVPIERYLHRERVWAVVCIIIAVVLLFLATWYNLAYRLPAGLS